MTLTEMLRVTDVMDEICDRAAMRLKLATDQNWYVTMVYRHGSFQLCARRLGKDVVAPMRNPSILVDVEIQNRAVDDLAYNVLAELRRGEEQLGSSDS